MPAILDIGGIIGQLTLEEGAGQMEETLVQDLQVGGHEGLRAR
jgi:hypothetical protein